MTTSADIRIPPATGSAPRGGQRPDEACARHVDGLFTYCLSVLCDHDAALAAVRSVRDLAVRHHGRLRDPSLQRAWLYSLARYACLLRLEDAAAPGRPDPEPGADAAPPPPPPGQQEERRRRLALLAWPEAAGTTPQQREALELAMRHGLAPAEVAAVLGLLPEEASALLVRAGAEVARTRTALRVLAAAECPELDLLGGGRTAGGHGGMLLVPALRRELVRHVDDCPTCRGTAGRQAPGDAWPGTGLLHGGTGAGVSLPLVDAPVAALAGTAGAAFLAGASAGRRARAARRGRGPAPAPGPARGRVHRAPAPAADPRFDRQGFPRHRADSPDLAAALRNRAVTTTVLAAVLAAPVAALWVAHRGGDGAGGPAAVSSVRVDTVGATPAGGPATAGPSPAAGAGPVDRETARRFGPLASRSGPVPQAAGAPAPLPQATAQAPGRAAVPVALRIPAGPPAAGPAAAGPAAAGAAAGRLSVAASEYGSRTVVTLTNTGAHSLFWRAVTDASWLRLSRDSGVLEPGQRITLIVTVDPDRVPRGRWTAHVALQPSESVVTLEGSGGPRPSPSGTHRPPTPSSPPSTPAPSGGPTGRPSPSDGPPSSPAPPSPQPSGPAPSSPAPSSPPGTSGPSGQPSGTASPTPSGSGTAPGTG